MRKRRAEKRYLKPDPKFNDVLVTKFINAIMYDGKKSVAERIIYGALDRISDRETQINGEASGCVSATCMAPSSFSI